MKINTRPWLSIIILTGMFTIYISSSAQTANEGNKSPIPQYTFSNTLEEQERELESNPLMIRFKESREKLSDDRYRPVYHYVNPEGNLNDPNGLCYWKGRWHLFYQAYPPEYPRQHWGHAVSEDLIHWKDLPLAIYPGPERACFSGSPARTFGLPTRRGGVYPRPTNDGCCIWGGHDMHPGFTAPWSLE